MNTTNPTKQGELSSQELNHILANLKKDKDYPSVFIFAVWAGNGAPKIEALVYEEPDGSKMTFESFKRNLRREAMQRDKSATAAECLRVVGDNIQRHKWSGDRWA